MTTKWEAPAGRQNLPPLRGLKTFPTNHPTARAVGYHLTAAPQLEIVVETHLLKFIQPVSHFALFSVFSG